MSLGTIYYDPKHPAGFSSVAKVVRSAKSKKKMYRNSCLERTHIPY
jgi:hypothetical protein